MRSRAAKAVNQNQKLFVHDLFLGNENVCTDVMMEWPIPETQNINVVIVMANPDCIASNTKRRIVLSFSLQHWSLSP